MSIVNIVELVVIGVLIIVHIVANFYNARCSCKLCTMFRSLFGQTSDSSVVPAPQENAELYELFQKFVQFLQNSEAK